MQDDRRDLPFSMAIRGGRTDASTGHHHVTWRMSAISSLSIPAVYHDRLFLVENCLHADCITEIGNGCGVYTLDSLELSCGPHEHFKSG